MGRESWYGFNAYSPLDLTRFTGPGAEDFGNYSEANFASDNGGTTNLGNFVLDPAEDLGDFSSSGNVFSGYAGAGQTGVKLQITSSDITFINLLGWDSSGGAPVSVGEINAVYNAVEAVSSASLTQKESWLDNMPGLGNSGNTYSVVNGTYVQANIVPVLNSFFLTALHYPTDATMQAQVNSGLTYTELVSADVGSQVWANSYNNGTLVNPNAPLTAQTVNEMYQSGLGHLPTQATMNGWLGGYTQASGFQEFVHSSSYAQNNNANDDTTLIGFANTALHSV